MVRSRIGGHASTNKALLSEALEIFGRSLTLRKKTITTNSFGEITNISTSDTSFTGDLQFGLDLDERYISAGLVEVGEGVLYIHPNALSTLPAIEDEVIDGSSVWEIVDQVEAPELEGTVCHLSYRVRRRVEASDS